MGILTYDVIIYIDDVITYILKCRNMGHMFQVNHPFLFIYLFYPFTITEVQFNHN